MNTSQISESAECFELEKEISSLISSVFVLERQLALCCALVEHHESNPGTGPSCRDSVVEAIGWAERLCDAGRAALLTGGTLVDKIVQLQ